MRIELLIELINISSPEILYEVRNELQANIMGLDLRIQEQPISEGQMGSELWAEAAHFVGHAVLTGMFEAAAVEVLKTQVVPIVSRIVKKHAKKSNIDEDQLVSSLEQNMGAFTTFKQDDGLKEQSFTDSTGKTEFFNNALYSLDTDLTYAILIGCSDYNNKFPSIPPAIGNIDDMYNVLTDKRYIGLKKENVLKVINENSDTIQEQLLTISEEKNIQTLIIYYAGHGFRTDLKKYYLASTNTIKRGDRIIGAVDFDFIKNDILRHSLAKQKILILDACHSGLAIQGLNSSIFDIDVKGSFTITSASADDVSYFRKDDRNTYFTGALVKLLKDGIANENEMLSLEDMYEFSKLTLGKKNFPPPTFINDLNIPASNFFISRNPAFSFEKLKRKPELLIREGKLDEALFQLHLLLKRFPDDTAFREKASQIQLDIVYLRLVRQGDDCFYNQKDYNAAADFFQKALQIKDDYAIQDKLRQSLLLKAKIEEQKKQFAPPIPIVQLEPLKVKHPITSKEPKLDNTKVEDSSKIKKRTRLIILSVIGLFVLCIGIIRVLISPINKPVTEQAKHNPIKTAADTLVAAEYTKRMVAEMNKRPKSLVNIDSIEIYIKNGANVDATDTNKCPPLFYAALRDLPQLTDLLVRSKANVNLRNDWGQHHFLLPGQSLLQKF